MRSPESLGATASLVAVLAFAGCSTWTTAERITAATAIGCAIGDVAMTYAGRSLGLSEANPLMQDQRFVVPLKAVSVGLAYASGELSGDRLWWWRSAAVMNCGVNAWNGIQIGRVLVR